MKDFDPEYRTHNYFEPVPRTRFFKWISDRHLIYQKRCSGVKPPWTEDTILRDYKFTNPFRENDYVTIWMRENWTNPNKNKSFEEIIFNCCLFRMIGTVEFAEEHKWVGETWEPERTKSIIENRLKNNNRTFTGAYIITNQGIKAPKSEVVVDHFLKPVWENKKSIGQIATEYLSLKRTHQELSKYRGWGGGGFMSYEVVTDLNYTPVLEKAKDKMTWANAGPGAVRGLNRIHDRKLEKSLNQDQCNVEMKELLTFGKENSYIKKVVLKNVPEEHIDMRTIEHSLCEWDKYERVRLGQGRPRSKYVAENTLFPTKLFKRGAVD